MDETRCTDPVILNEWHVLGALAELAPGEVRRTRLLGVPLAFARGTGDGSGDIAVWTADEDGHGGGAAAIDLGGRNRLPVLQRYGYLWTTLGTPDHDLFALPECDEPDRRTLSAGTIGVNVSGPRAVENFLDMGHFPFVHTNYLGVEPHTEVKDYDITISDEPNEVVATRCVFYQPKAAIAASEGFEVEYVYRVPHPYCAVLYKSNPLQPHRRDVIGLFAQPVGEERICANMMLSMIDDRSSDAELKRFQQTIFGQDRPMLENQLPRRLPLDPRAEIPIRADSSSLAYRRWLRRNGVTYGTIPLEGPAPRASSGA